MDILTLIIIFAVGIIASFVGGIAGGGGGLISIPALIFLGLPPNIAIATNRMGVAGYTASTIYKFSKAKKVIYKIALPLIVLAIIGGFIGANILIKINEAVLSKIVGALIIVSIPFIFVNRDSGIKRKSVSKGIKAGGFAAYFGAAVYDGFFGAAGGIFVMLILVFMFGLTYIEANATDKIPYAFNLAISLVIFCISGIVNYHYGIALFLGMIIGGYAGAHMAIKKGDRFVRLAFSAVILASAIKLIFF